MVEGRCLDDDTLIRQFRLMYDAFFEDLKLVPEGNYHEIAYEAFEANPVEETRCIRF